MSFSLFYFNDSLLADSTGRVPAHLGAGRNTGHTSKKKSAGAGDAKMQSSKRVPVDDDGEQILGLQAVNVEPHHSNRSAMKGNIKPVIEPDHRTLRDALMQKDDNSVTMNEDKVLNGSVNSNAANGVGPVPSKRNVNANPYQGAERHAKGSLLNHLSSNHVHNARRSPPRTSQQLHNQTSYDNNYILSRLCSDPLCTSFLSERDLGNFTACKRRAQAAAYLKKKAKTKKAQEFAVDQLASRFSECRFMNGSGRSPVGLVSFPGSGNTWVRGLLQKATGICTGAVYCDRMLRMGGFDGEGVQSGAVIVVKIHSSTPLWTRVKGQEEFSAKGRPFFDSVVLVVRNPFHALVSEWNRQLSTKYGLGHGNGTAHINVYGREYFQTYSRWTKFVEVQTKRWKGYFDWLLKRPPDHDIILVRYEDLKRDLLHEIERILTFLRFPYTYAELSARLSQDFSLFHRSSKPRFDHFTSIQEELVNTAVKHVSQQLQDTFGTTYNIDEYISTHQ